MSDLSLTHLTMIRHSYAVEAGDFDGRDYDRPLSEKGLETARELDAVLPEVTPAPDLVIVSGALRAVQTFEELKYLKSAKPRVVVSQEVYDFMPGQLYNFLVKEQKGAKVAAIIGHNPAVSQLYSMLTGQFVALSPCQARTLILGEEEKA